MAKDSATNSGQRWFLFVGDHHTGPFSPQQLLSFYERGQLNEHSLVWREGTAQWQELWKWPEFQGHVLPPVPTSPAPKKSPPDIEVELPKDAGPPPLPVMEKRPPKKRTSPLKPPPDPDERDEKLRRQLRLQRSLMVFSCAIVGAFLATIFYYSFVETGPSEELFVGLSIDDYRRLSEQRSEQVDNIAQMSIALAVGRESEVVWLASNYRSQEYILYLSMSADGVRSTARSSTRLSSRAHLKDGMAEFRHWTLESGESFASGIYQWSILAYPKKVLLAGQKSGQVTMQRVGDGGDSLEIPRASQPVFKLSGQMYFGPLEVGEVIERLKEHNQREHRQVIELMQLWEQGLQTFSQMLERMESLALEVLSEIETGDDFKRFEAQYAESVAGVLQGIVIDLAKNFEDSKDLLAESMALLDREGGHNFSVTQSELAQEINHIGRDVMALSVDWSEAVQQHQQIDRSVRERLGSVIREDSLERQRDLRKISRQLEQLSQAWHDHLHLKSADFETTVELELLTK